MSSSLRALVLLIACFLVLPPTFAAGNPTTNVVIVTIDTLRADHLGCYGYKHIRTPNIDALAADGVRFERAYNTVLVRLPANTDILTGSYLLMRGILDFSASTLNHHHPPLSTPCIEYEYSTATFI